MPQFTALVTGASRGIGRAIAYQLASRGCQIAVHYHANRAAADATLASLPGQGHAPFVADLSVGEEIEALWRQVLVAYGRVDILINNAGVYEELSPVGTSFLAWRKTWQSTLRTNLLGPANLCHFAANTMTAAESAHPPAFGRGRIVNISSRGAFRGEPQAPAYGASKAGLNALSQSLAQALAPHQVYVYCLAPGWVNTEMAKASLEGPKGAEIKAQHPLGRITSADEVARAAAFCALDAPAAMTGSILDVNGASYLRT